MGFDVGKRKLLTLEESDMDEAHYAMEPGTMAMATATTIRRQYAGEKQLRSALEEIEQTKEIIGLFAAKAANYIVYYGKPLIAISHTNLGSNSPRQ